MESLHNIEPGAFEADYALAMQRYAEAISPESEELTAPDGRRARFAAALIAVDALAIRERFDHDPLQKLYTLIAGLNTHGNLDIQIPDIKQKEAAEMWRHAQRIVYASIKLPTDVTMSGAELLNALVYSDRSIQIVPPTLND